MHRKHFLPFHLVIYSLSQIKSLPALASAVYCTAGSDIDLCHISIQMQTGQSNLSSGLTVQGERI